MNLTARVFPLGLSKLESHRLAMAALALILAAAGPILNAATLTPLYSFTNGVDGAYPSAGLLRGNDGNFYGATDNGGTNGDGAIFKITSAGVLTTLYSFTNGLDGALVAGPRPRLCQGRDGNLYGTTYYGGSYVAGNIFRITTAGVLTVLYSFTNGADGACPCGGVAQGADGNFYGTTGGTDGHGPHPSWGGVFKITPSGALTALYTFTNGVDGATPTSALAQGRDGNFYGTTDNGGTKGDGAIFRITPSGALTPLYSFTNGVDGATPTAGLVQASDGNFYGTTYSGGAKNLGSVFKITPEGKLTSLYSFTNGMDCAGPFAGVVQATDGDFYGITRFGGVQQAGGIFQISSNGAFTPLYTFTNGADGERPYGGLVQGSDGNLYGTTEFGGLAGVGAGTFFRFNPMDSPVSATLLPATLALDPVPSNNVPIAGDAGTNAFSPISTTPSPPVSLPLPRTNATATLNTQPSRSTNASMSVSTTSPPAASIHLAPTAPAVLNPEGQLPPLEPGGIRTNPVFTVTTAPPEPASLHLLPAASTVANAAPSRSPSKPSNTGTNVPPGVSAMSPKPAGLPLQVARVSGTGGSGLRLRSSASLSSRVLAIMPDGSRVTLLGDTQTSGGFRWKSVQYGNLTGWASSAYLVFGVAAK
jgi:uncharacterized repeat protein (TIGR03803 family)